MIPKKTAKMQKGGKGNMMYTLKKENRIAKGSTPKVYAKGYSHSESLEALF